MSDTTTAAPAHPPTEYGVFYRDITDRWPGTPLTKERKAGIVWGKTATEIDGIVSTNPDAVAFTRSPSGRVRRSYRGL